MSCSYWRTVLPLALLIAALPAVPRARAQSSGPTPQSSPTVYRIAGDEAALWLTQVTGEKSDILRRERGGSFDLPRSVTRPIAEQCAFDGGLIFAFNDGSVYRIRQKGADIAPERNVPNNRAPLGLTAVGGQLFALLPPEADADSGGPGAPRVALYDGQEWQIVAACEPAATGELSGRRRTRLLVVADFLVLVWREPNGKLGVATRARSAASWTITAAPDAADAAAFWLVTANVAPTFVAAMPDAAGGEKLGGWRLLLSDTGEATWQPVAWRVTQTPSGGHPLRFEDAEGFNQQLALLARDERNDAVLVFAREGDSPSEVPISVSAVFEAPARAAWRHELVRMLTFLLLVLLVIGMFTFRRDSMTETFALPPRLIPAFSFQRLMAGVIDIAPFAWFAALACEVDPIAGMRELFEWGLYTGTESRIPALGITLWWALTAGGFTIYCFVMEATMGRTIGKLLTGTRVVGAQGRRVTLGQAAVRNALRLVELIPQFWMFAFLIVLSRNRQRLGDVFARTVVVRLRREDPSARRTDAEGDSRS